MAKTDIQCSCCGKEKRISNFYSSNSPIHSFYGKLPICKACMLSMVDSENIRTVTTMLRMCDKPFIAHLWEASIEEAKKGKRSVFQTYMKNVAMRQHINKNWDDSEFEVEYIEQEISSSSGITQEVLERWRGWDEDKIHVLEALYQDLINSYEHDTPIQKSIYRNIAVAQMQADDAISNGKSNDYKKYMDVISGLMNDAKIKPLQETAADDGSL